MSIPLLKPDEVLKTIRLPEGFKVSIFAAEPDVRQPLSMTFDAYCESPKDFELSLNDRVIILEDPDHTGHYHQAFSLLRSDQQGTSVEVGFGGVWVLAAPKLLFILSKDGNTPSGEPIVMLDGFDNTGKGLQHAWLCASVSNDWALNWNLVSHPDPLAKRIINAGWHQAT